MGEWVTLADGSKLFCPYPLEQRPLREEESEEPNSQSWHVALALASVLGFTGAHRFYTGKIATAIVWLLTGGLLARGRGRHRGLALEGRGRDAAAPQGGQGEPRRRGDGRRLGLRRMDDDRGGGRVDGAHGRVDGGLRTKVLENWKT